MNRQSVTRFYWSIILFVGIFPSATTFAQTRISCGADRILRQDTLTQKRLKQFNQQFQEHKSNKAALDLTTLYTIPVVVHVYHLGEAVGTGSNVSDAAVQAAIASLNQSFRAQGAFSSSLDVKIQFVLASRTPGCQTTNGIVRVDARSIAGYQTNGCRADDEPMQNSLRTLSSWPEPFYVNIRIVHKMTDAAGFAWFLNDLFIPAQYTNAANGDLWGHEMGHSFNLYHTFEGDGDNAYCPVNNNPDMDGDLVSDTAPHKMGDACSVYSTTSTNPCSGVAFGSLLKNFMSYSGCESQFTPKQIERMRYALQYYRTGLINSLGKVPPPAGDLPPAVACSVSATNGLSQYFGIAAFSLQDMALASSNSSFDNGTNYSDKTCLAQTSLQIGTAYSFSLTSLNSNYVRAKVYIDYNNNGFFTDPNELVFTSPTSVSLHTGTILPPAGATTNRRLRMRVMLDPTTIPNACTLPGFAPYGSGMAEDYAVTLTSNTACPAPTATLTGSQTILAGQPASLTVALTGTAPWNLTTSNGLTFSGIAASPTVFTVTATSNSTVSLVRVSNGCGTGTATGTAVLTVILPCTAPTSGSTSEVGITSANLNWSNLGADARYTLQWRPTGSSNWTTIASLSASTYSLTGLSASTTYEWQVRTDCSPTTSSSFTAPRSFTTCLPPTATLTGSQTILAGQPASLTVALTGTAPWNLTISNGLTFTGIAASPTVFTVTTTSNTTISLLRVSNGCDSGTTSGTALLTVVVPVTCAMPTSGSLGGVSATFAYLVWTNMGPGVQYNLQWKPAGNPNWTTVSSLTTSIYSLTTLLPATAYEWQIQALCTNGASSTYTPVRSFTTTICLSPVNPNEANLLATSVRLNWSSYVSTSQTVQWKPVALANWNTTGVITTGLYNLTGLVAGTAYEWQVRSNCPDGSSSIYTSPRTFTTTCLPPTATLTGSQTILAGQPASLTVALTGMAPWNLTVSNGVTLSGIATSPTVFTVTATSNTTISLLRVSNGCDSGTTSGTTVVTVALPCMLMYSIRDGNWDDPTVWSCNRLPTNTDLVEVRHLITLPENVTGYAQRLRYTSSGKLIQTLNATLRLGF